MTDLDELVDKIEAWGQDRGLHDDPGAQYEKLLEEAGELGRAHGNLNRAEGKSADGGLYEADLLNRLRHDVKDGVGDMVVVLIQFAEAHNLSLVECVEHAWHEVRNREGRTVDGRFVKEADLDE